MCIQLLALHTGRITEKVYKIKSIRAQVDVKENQSSWLYCSKKIEIHLSVLILSTLSKGFRLHFMQMLEAYLQGMLCSAKA